MRTLIAATTLGFLAAACQPYQQASYSTTPGPSAYPATYSGNYTATVTADISVGP